MELKSFVIPPIGENTYVLSGACDGQAIVVDPADASVVAGYLDANGLKCTHILLTHGHFDHIIGVAELQRRYGARVYIGEKDAPMLSDDRENLSVFGGSPVAPCEADVMLHDGDAIPDAAGFSAVYIATPGHTVGGGCYYFEREGILFSGDTLFFQSIGNTQFPGGSMSQLKRSILEKLYTLPETTNVYPGHMDETTIGHERRYNMFFRAE